MKSFPKYEYTYDDYVVSVDGLEKKVIITNILKGKRKQISLKQYIDMIKHLKRIKEFNKLFGIKEENEYETNIN